MEDAIHDMERDRDMFAAIGDFDNVESIAKEIERIKILGHLCFKEDEQNGD